MNALYDFDDLCIILLYSCFVFYPFGMKVVKNNVSLVIIISQSDTFQVKLKKKLFLNEGFFFFYPKQYSGV